MDSGVGRKHWSPNLLVPILPKEHARSKVCCHGILGPAKQGLVFGLAATYRIVALFSISTNESGSAVCFANGCSIKVLSALLTDENCALEGAHPKSARNGLANIQISDWSYTPCVDDTVSGLIRVQHVLNGSFQGLL
jgi:hypothetical protein